MKTEFQQRLDASRSHSEKVYDSCNDIKVIHEEAMRELSSYETIIPDFFSYRNEAVRIKELYKKLKQLDYARNRVINCVDVGCAGYLYNEYFDGMYTFIDKFFAEVSGNGSSVQLMEKQLQTAIQGDPLFIESLFGGKNNAPSEQVLTDAINNVEYLVDFLDRLKGLKQMVADICNRANELSTYKYSVDAAKLAVKSTCTFSYRILGAIVDIYNSIYESLEDRYVKPDTKPALMVF